MDVNLNREKLKTTLVPMPYPLSPHQPASWISRHSQDGGKVVKQEKKFGIIKIFTARESLVSDIPAGDGKIANIFYSVNDCALYVDRRC